MGELNIPNFGGFLSSPQFRITINMTSTVFSKGFAAQLLGGLGRAGPKVSCSFFVIAVQISQHHPLQLHWKVIKKKQTQHIQTPPEKMLLEPPKKTYHPNTVHFSFGVRLDVYRETDTTDTQFTPWHRALKLWSWLWSIDATWQKSKVGPGSSYNWRHNPHKW